MIYYKPSKSLSDSGILHVNSFELWSNTQCAVGMLRNTETGFGTECLTLLIKQALCEINQQFVEIIKNNDALIIKDLSIIPFDDDRYIGYLAKGLVAPLSPELGSISDNEIINTPQWRHAPNISSSDKIMTGINWESKDGRLEAVNLILELCSGSKIGKVS